MPFQGQKILMRKRLDVVSIGVKIPKLREVHIMALYKSPTINLAELLNKLKKHSTHD